MLVPLGRCFSHRAYRALRACPGLAGVAHESHLFFPFLIYQPCMRRLIAAANASDATLSTFTGRTRPPPSTSTGPSLRRSWAVGAGASFRVGGDTTTAAPPVL